MDRLKKTSDTSVAWYKLADLIARHEREKALNVYRLLSHSFEDKAYALQLEGDILLNLKDAKAVDKYKQAAFLYRKESRWVNAICVCEHLMHVQSDNAELMVILLDLYLKVRWHAKFDETLDCIIKKLAIKKFDEDLLFQGFRRLLENERAGNYQASSCFFAKRLRAKEKSIPVVFFDRLKRLL